MNCSSLVAAISTPHIMFITTRQAGRSLFNAENNKK
jgi:hypothetical protein